MWQDWVVKETDTVNEMIQTLKAGSSWSDARILFPIPLKSTSSTT